MSNSKLKSGLNHATADITMDKYTDGAWSKIVIPMRGDLEHESMIDDAGFMHHFTISYGTCSNRNERYNQDMLAYEVISVHRNHVNEDWAFLVEASSGTGACCTVICPTISDMVAVVRMMQSLNEVARRS